MIRVPFQRLFSLTRRNYVSNTYLYHTNSYFSKRKWNSMTQKQQMNYCTITGTESSYDLYKFRNLFDDKGIAKQTNEETIKWLKDNKVDKIQAFKWLIKHYSMTVNLQAILNLLPFLSKLIPKPDASLHSVIIETLCKQKNLTLAQKYHSELLYCKLIPDDGITSTFLRLCIRENQFEHAIHTLIQSLSLGIQIHSNIIKNIIEIIVEDKKINVLQQIIIHCDNYLHEIHLEQILENKMEESSKLVYDCLDELKDTKYKPSNEFITKLMRNFINCEDIYHLIKTSQLIQHYSLQLTTIQIDLLIQGCMLAENKKLMEKFIELRKENEYSFSTLNFSTCSCIIGLYMDTNSYHECILFLYDLHKYNLNFYSSLISLVFNWLLHQNKLFYCTFIIEDFSKNLSLINIQKYLFQMDQLISSPNFFSNSWISKFINLNHDNNNKNFKSEFISYLITKILKETKFSRETLENYNQLKLDDNSSNSMLKKENFNENNNNNKFIFYNYVLSYYNKNNKSIDEIIQFLNANQIEFNLSVHEKILLNYQNFNKYVEILHYISQKIKNKKSMFSLNENMYKSLLSIIPNISSIDLINFLDELIKNNIIHYENHYKLIQNIFHKINQDKQFKLQEKLINQLLYNIKKNENLKQPDEDITKNIYKYNQDYLLIDEENRTILDTNGNLSVDILYFIHLFIENENHSMESKFTYFCKYIQFCIFEKIAFNNQIISKMIFQLLKTNHVKEAENFIFHFNIFTHDVISNFIFSYCNEFNKDGDFKLLLHFLKKLQNKNYIPNENMILFILNEMNKNLNNDNFPFHIYSKLFVHLYEIGVPFDLLITTFINKIKQSYDNNTKDILKNQFFPFLFDSYYINILSGKADLLNYLIEFELDDEILLILNTYQAKTIPIPFSILNNDKFFSIVKKKKIDLHLYFNDIDLYYCISKYNLFFIFLFENEKYNILIHFFNENISLSSSAIDFIVQFISNHDVDIWDKNIFSLLSDSSKFSLFDQISTSLFSCLNGNSIQFCCRYSSIIKTLPLHNYIFNFDSDPFLIFDFFTLFTSSSTTSFPKPLLVSLSDILVKFQPQITFNHLSKVNDALSSCFLNILHKNESPSKLAIFKLILEYWENNDFSDSLSSISWAKILRNLNHRSSYFADIITYLAKSADKDKDKFYSILSSAVVRNPASRRKVVLLVSRVNKPLGNSVYTVLNPLKALSPFSPAYKKQSLEEIKKLPFLSSIEDV